MDVSGTCTWWCCRRGGDGGAGRWALDLLPWAVSAEIRAARGRALVAMPGVLVAMGPAKKADALLSARFACLEPLLWRGGGFGGVGGATTLGPGAEVRDGFRDALSPVSCRARPMTCLRCRVTIGVLSLRPHLRCLRSLVRRLLFVAWGRRTRAMTGVAWHKRSSRGKMEGCGSGVWRAAAEASVSCRYSFVVRLMHDILLSASCCFGGTLRLHSRACFAHHHPHGTQQWARDQLHAKPENDRARSEELDQRGRLSRDRAKSDHDSREA